VGAPCSQSRLTMYVLATPPLCVIGDHYAYGVPVATSSRLRGIWRELEQCVYTYCHDPTRPHAIDDQTNTKRGDVESLSCLPAPAYPPHSRLLCDAL